MCHVFISPSCFIFWHSVLFETRLIVKKSGMLKFFKKFYKIILSPGGCAMGPWY